MENPKTLTNCYGQSWRVEHHESERLTHIGGYLMTYRDSGRITLSTQLTAADKARARSQLLEQLSKTPVGTSGVLLWHPADE